VEIGIINLKHKATENGDEDMSRTIQEIPVFIRIYQSGAWRKIV